MFGSTILAELPDSITGVARFSKAMYVRPEFASLGHVVTMIHEGKTKTFVAKSIKHVIPLSFDEKLGPEFLVKFDANLKPSESGTQPSQVVLDDIPKNIDSVKNTPAAWIQKFGKTSGCNTCLRDSFHGRVHNRACVERYKSWLREQVASGTPIQDVQFQEDEAVENLDLESKEDIQKRDRVPDAGIIPRRMLAKGPRPAALVDPALKSEAQSESRLRVDSVERAPMDFQGDSSQPSDSMPPFVGEDVAMEGNDVFEYSPTPPNEIDVEMGIANNLLNGMITEFDPDNYDRLLASIYSMQHSIYHVKGSQVSREDYPFCGETISLGFPSYVISDVSGDYLDPQQTYDGMKTELDNLTKHRAGKLMGESEALQFCKSSGIRPISTRFVRSQKDTDLVRARLVAREVAKGQASARDLEISSPTTSAESLRISLSQASHIDATIIGLDVSAAFMASPLKTVVVLKMPPSIVWGDGTPVYVKAQKALNGLRASGKAWVDHFSWVCQQLGLQSGSVETTVFSGYVGSHWVWLVVYVDDVLIVSGDGKTAEAVFAHFEKYLTIKRTGMIKSSSAGGGRLRFLGRNLVRNPSESMISCFVDETYLDSSFQLYGLVKGTSNPPDLRPILDSEERCQPLSSEASSRFKATLGKLSWLCQTWMFLCIYVCLLATGMAEPLDKHEHAMRAVLRWLISQRGQKQTYPATSDVCDRGSEEVILAYSDASWAPLKLLKRRSISGSVFFFRNSAVKSFCRLQQLVALSSCEAELSALAESGVESVGIKRLVGHIIGLKDDEINIEMLTDSQAAWRVLKGSGLQRKSRHVELRVFWIQQRVQSEEIFLLWREGSEMIAGICTKTLGRKLFELFRFRMGFSEREDFSPLAIKEVKSSKKIPKDQKVSFSEPIAPDADNLIDAMPSISDSVILDASELLSHPKMYTEMFPFQLIFIELCCGTESRMAHAIFKGVHGSFVIRVTEKLRI